MGDYTRPPTAEEVRDWWLSFPTAGASEKYDREKNYEQWASGHGLTVQVECED